MTMARLAGADCVLEFLHVDDLFEVLPTFIVASPIIYEPLSHLGDEGGCPLVG